MREVAPGDVVFSFADTWIRKVGLVQSYCLECPRPPEFGAAGRAWNDIGWRVSVRFFSLLHPIRPKDHIDRLRPLLPERLSPLRADGGGNQMYLAALPDPMARVLGDLIGPEFAPLVAAAADLSRDEFARGISEDQEQIQWEEHLLTELNQRPNLSPTQREAIVQARVGQGLFRRNVAHIETRCRLTGVTEPTHLRASHTKPWRASSDQERLDGENGFLLTPTVDHLFDRGFLSFEDNGELLISPVAQRGTLERMGIPCSRVCNVGTFSTGQKEFLSYHRDNVFLAQRLSGQRGS